MVYVDNANIPFRNMRMSHMVADSTKELNDMAQKIGLSKKYIQHENSFNEHYDVCVSKKKLAIKYGAILIDSKELVAIIKNKIK
ncbi:MAG: DUF4031 domain-containing protein [Nitrosopumilaceae archaeon]|jgi:hypothetical protein